MDFSALFSRILEIQPRNRLALLLGSLGLILFVLGLIWSINPFSRVSPWGGQPQEVEFIAAESTAEASSSAQKLVIDVSGAVLKPGVYSLKEDARIQDALIAAGGLSEDADRQYISKAVNLAAKITDGAKIYIPSKDESITSTTGITGSSVLGSSSSLININSATSSQLDKLPGIGAVTAQKIIEGRPYSSIDELKTKKIVGSKVYEQIKEKISVY